jgi:hypothetical protein
MKKKLARLACSTLFVFSLAAVSGGAQAADAADAPTLLQKSCDNCHAQLFAGKADGVYTRSNRRVSSKQVLLDQVKLWNSSSGAKWGDAEIEAVVRYLDETYYKLP